MPLWRLPRPRSPVPYSVSCVTTSTRPLSFSGDCGSLLIGFLLGCFSLIWSAKSVTIIGMTAPLMALSIPLLDTDYPLSAVFSDANLCLGLIAATSTTNSSRAASLRDGSCSLIYGLCGICAGFSLLASVAHEQFAGVIILLFCLGAWIGSSISGTAEFDAARRMVLGGTFRRSSTLSSARHFPRRSCRGPTPDECWEVLHHSYSDFGFNEIKLKLGDRSYAHTTNGHHIANSWTIRIALSETEYLNLSRDFDTEAPPIIAPFADMIGKILQTKIAVMRHEGPEPRPDLAVPRICVALELRPRPLEKTATASSPS